MSSDAPRAQTGGRAFALSPTVVQVRFGDTPMMAPGAGNAAADWFGPLSPMKPAAPPFVTGRRFDYQSGYNLQTRARPGELGFDQLRAFADAYDILRLVIETRKSQMSRLKWAILPRARPDAATMKEVQTDHLNPICKQITDFLRRPDRRLFWNDWLRMALEDLFVLDAPAIWKRRNRAGQLYALEIIDGATIKPIITEAGRQPERGPAFQQILKGLPAVEYDSRDLMYLPLNRRPHKVYGYGPVEQIIMTVNIALKRQIWQLQHWTEGNLPQALIGVPESWTPEQISAFQTNFDDLHTGNMAERRRARFVPAASAKSYTPTHNDSEMFGRGEEWLARVVCYAMGVDPTPFIQSVNRATAESAAEEAIKDGIAPVQSWVKNLVDGVIIDEFGTNEVEFVWQDDTIADPEKLTKVICLQVESGLISLNEARAELGKTPVDHAAFNVPMVKTGVGYVPVEPPAQADGLGNMMGPGGENLGPAPAPGGFVGPGGEMLAPPEGAAAGGENVAPADDAGAEPGAGADAEPPPDDEPPEGGGPAGGGGALPGDNGGGGGPAPAAGDDEAAAAAAAMSDDDLAAVEEEMAAQGIDVADAGDGEAESQADLFAADEDRVVPAGAMTADQIDDGGDVRSETPGANVAPADVPGEGGAAGVEAEAAPTDEPGDGDDEPQPPRPPSKRDVRRAALDRLGALGALRRGEPAGDLAKAAERGADPGKNERGSARISRKKGGAPYGVNERGDWRDVKSPRMIRGTPRRAPDGSGPINRDEAALDEMFNRVTAEKEAARDRKARRAQQRMGGRRYLHPDRTASGRAEIVKGFGVHGFWNGTEPHRGGGGARGGSRRGAQAGVGGGAASGGAEAKIAAHRVAQRAAATIAASAAAAAPPRPSVGEGLTRLGRGRSKDVYAHPTNKNRVIVSMQRHAATEAFLDFSRAAHAAKAPIAQHLPNPSAIKVEAGGVTFQTARLQPNTTPVRIGRDENGFYLNGLPKTHPQHAPLLATVTALDSYLKQALPGSRHYFDLSAQNFMVTRSGKIVMNDPVEGGAAIQARAMAPSFPAAPARAPARPKAASAPRPAAANAAAAAAAQPAARPARATPTKAEQTRAAQFRASAGNGLPEWMTMGTRPAKLATMRWAAKGDPAAIASRLRSLPREIDFQRQTLERAPKSHQAVERRRLAKLEAEHAALRAARSASRGGGGPAR
jgi:hypothetical protein